MKKALISPVEQRESGYRVADVCSKEFEIAKPFFWVDCPDDLEPDTKWFDPTDNQFKDFPVVEPDEPISQPISTGTQEI